MTILFIILIFMLLAHIVDDYYLQGILSSMKQKDWWNKNYPDEKYKHDYITALICHGLSWSIMINIPIIIYSLINKIDLGFFYLNIPINLLLHSFMDDLKANKKLVNLTCDQLYHLVQIYITWFIFFVIMLK